MGNKDAIQTLGVCADLIVSNTIFFSDGFKTWARHLTSRHSDWASLTGRGETHMTAMTCNSTELLRASHGKRSTNDENDALCLEWASINPKANFTTLDEITTLKYDGSTIGGIGHSSTSIAFWTTDKTLRVIDRSTCRGTIYHLADSIQALNSSFLWMGIRNVTVQKVRSDKVDTEWTAIPDFGREPFLNDAQHEVTRLEDARISENGSMLMWRNGSYGFDCALIK